MVSTHRQAGVWPAHVLEAIAVCAETLFSAPPRTLHLNCWQWPSARTFLESRSPLGQEDLAINGFEAYWVNRACEHWVEILRSKLVLIFCDNSTAVRGFIHGSSASPAVCQNVGRTWQCWIENQITLWIEWGAHTVKSSGFSHTPWMGVSGSAHGLKLDEIVCFSERPADLQ